MSRSYYMGLKKIQFIGHGDWADPELVYKNKTFNYYDIEDLLLADYRDRLESQGISNDNDQGFEEWVKSHKMLCYSIIDDALPYMRERVDVIASRCVCNVASLAIIELDDWGEWLKVALITDDMIKKSRPLKIHERLSDGASYFNYNGRREYLSEYIRNN